MKADPAPRSTRANRQFHPARSRLWKEMISWFWVVLAFVLLEGTVAQARMIPSGSMENTLLVGDHLIVSLAGYDAGIPFTNVQFPLWRQPHRQQIFVIRNVEPNSPDLIKRVIGIPGDRIKMIGETVYVNGQLLNEPYTLVSSPNPPFRQFPPAENPSLDGRLTSEWAAQLPKDVVNGELIVPKGEYFMMGDNRDDSYDSRYWGFVPRANIIGTPAFIYMSINAPEQVWDPAHLSERVEAYLKVFYDPGEVRWKRIFRTF